MDGDQGPFGPVVNGTMVVVFYQYRPSQTAGYAFLALFSLTSLAHIIYLFTLRAFWFTPFLLGGIGERPCFPLTVAGSSILDIDIPSAS